MVPSSKRAGGPLRSVSSVVDAAARVVDALTAHDALATAAAIAFWFFLSLVPLLVLAGFLVGHVARSGGMDVLAGPLLDVAPGSARDLVRKEIDRLAAPGARSIAPLGAFGFLWTASSGLHNLMDVLETAVGAAPRAWWKQRAMAVGWVVLGLATACMLAATLVRAEAMALGAAGAPSSSHAVHEARPEERAQGRAAVGAARGALPQRVRKAVPAAGDEALATGLVLVAGTTVLAGFYRYAVARPPNLHRRVWPGAVTAVASWLGVSWIFGVYAVSLANYALYYGSLTAVAVLLLWLYLTSLSIIVGAEVNGQLEGVSLAAATAPPAPDRPRAR